MGDTVEALAYKADVPSRTKDWLGEKKDTVLSRVSGASHAVSEHTPDGQDVKQRGAALKRTAERNPLGLAIAGAAVGFVAGVLAPSTKVEDERLGPMADEVKSTAVETGKEAVERAKVVAEEAGTTAMDTARDVGQEQTEELAESLQSQARGSLVSDDPSQPLRG